MAEFVLNPPLHHQNWVIMLLLSFFIIFIIAYIRSNNWITNLGEHFSKSRTTTGISYKKKTAEEEQARILMTLFSAGTVVLYIGIYAADYFKIDFITYLKLVVLFLAFLFIKKQLALIIGYTFNTTESIKLATEQYFNIIFLLSTFLYSLLILRCFLFTHTNIQIPDTIALSLTIISMLLIIIMIFQFFHKSILDSLHILLYLCTLEFLPYFGMFYFLRWVMYG